MKLASILTALSLVACSSSGTATADDNFTDSQYDDDLERANFLPAQVADANTLIAYRISEGDDGSKVLDGLMTAAKVCVGQGLALDQTIRVRANVATTKGVAPDSVAYTFEAADILKKEIHESWFSGDRVEYVPTGRKVNGRTTIEVVTASERGTVTQAGVTTAFSQDWIDPDAGDPDFVAFLERINEDACGASPKPATYPPPYTPNTGVGE